MANIFPPMSRSPAQYTRWCPQFRVSVTCGSAMQMARMRSLSIANQFKTVVSAYSSGLRLRIPYNRCDGQPASPRANLSPEPRGAVPSPAVRQHLRARSGTKHALLRGSTRIRRGGGRELRVWWPLARGGASRRQHRPRIDESPAQLQGIQTHRHSSHAVLVTEDVMAKYLEWQGRGVRFH